MALPRSFLTQAETIPIPLRMAAVLGILYGLQFILVIYGITYISARGMFRGRRTSIVLLFGKYLIYWFLITFGFKHLPHWAVLTGFVGGIYLSLPVLYWVNKIWVNQHSHEDRSNEKGPDL